MPSSFAATNDTPKKFDANGSRAKAPKAGTPSGGTLLSFFSRQAGSPAVVNPVKAVKAQARVTLVGSAKENKPAVTQQEEPARASKFFGAGRGSKVELQKSSTAAIVPPVMHEPDHEALSDDFEAEAALRDIELGFDLPSEAAEIDEPEEAVEERRVSPAEPAPPTHRPALCGIQEQAPDVDGGSVQSEAGGIVVPVSPPPTSEALVETPSPERQKVAISASGQSDVGVSSPADSNVAQAGWPTPELDQSPVLLSSPITPRNGFSISPPPPIVKEEAAPAPAQTTAAPFVTLSSDPIILSSDTGSCAEQATPRPPKRSPRPPKQRKSPILSAKGKLKTAPSREARSKTVAVWEDTPGPRAASGESAPKTSASKRRKQTEVIVDDDEGVSEAVRSVAASWRAKFMLQTAVKVSLLTFKPASRACRADTTV